MKNHFNNCIAILPHSQNTLRYVCLFRSANPKNWFELLAIMNKLLYISQNTNKACMQICFKIKTVFTNFTP